jgi:hypothetical protein
MNLSLVRSSAGSVEIKIPVCGISIVVRLKNPRLPQPDLLSAFDTMRHLPQWAILLPRDPGDPLKLFTADLGQRINPPDFAGLMPLEVALLQIAQDEDFFEIAFIGDGVRGTDPEIDQFLQGAADAYEALSSTGNVLVRDVLVVEVIEVDTPATRTI